jgi:hypothetical protein
MTINVYDASIEELPLKDNYLRYRLHVSCFVLYNTLHVRAQVQIFPDR